MNTAAKRAMTTEQRFMEKVAKHPSGCWEWTAATTKQGYGWFWYQTRNWYAHRVSYEMFVGPIPDGLQIDHLCRNTSCVNPQHLEPVTCRVNLLRGNTFQRHNASKTHCKNGHPLAGENLYVNPTGSRCCRTCSRESARRNADKTKARHATYKDVQSACVVCGKEFVTRRYHPARTCSKPCANELRGRTKRAA